jgi:hypothetical protein
MAPPFIATLSLLLAAASAATLAGQLQQQQQLDGEERGPDPAERWEDFIDERILSQFLSSLDDEIVRRKQSGRVGGPDLPRSFPPTTTGLDIMTLRLRVYRSMLLPSSPSARSVGC